MIMLFMVLIAALLFSGCAAHSSLEPIGQGNTGLSVGGIGYPLYPTVELRYGVTDWMDVGGGIHLSPLLDDGFGGDLKATIFPFGTAPEKSYTQAYWLIRPTFGLQFGYTHVAYPFDADPLMIGRITPTLAWPTPIGSLFTGADFAIVETPIERISIPFIGTGPDIDPIYMINPFLGHRFKLSDTFYFSAEAQAYFDADTGDGPVLAAAFLTFEWEFGHSDD